MVYNTNKVDLNKGELMRVANFGALQALCRLRPQDYINYLQMIAAQNTRVKKPQFHAVLSAKGKMYSERELTDVAVAWLEKMGYSQQPYLIVYHKDTDNNHVHVVSVRVAKDGKKINSAYEKLRAIGNLKEVLSVEKALAYTFSTRAQFFMVMESLDLPCKEVDEKVLADKLGHYEKPTIRIAELRELLRVVKDHSDFKNYLKHVHHIELIFHSSEGKQPYGYSIIDHDHKLVLKGSEVMSLKELLAERSAEQVAIIIPHNEIEEKPYVASIKPVWIADDVDDQQIHGMRRRRQKKARTNTR
ncbi:relaxase/mobilization nuclease domain-containing protein [Mucilaginibacter sp. 21P]|uniref:relaxase/mobilization nuclease domain-containing protein n=1 Tax=Mucilaginibacter sp. 21P TaxID=2778902 RepID=UPI001C571817|nr:relaxase/mobilization nuclease domain-containing protein [Mucilaginibacter sp. 21P]QXV63658.1 relaxase/mobilization nuclease domain-containing protein [Mucilaginibacter sp. 21P]